MNIAVVDDEVIVQKRLKGALEKEGHQVDTFASGEDLLRELEGAAYDLIFLDVVLPGISGMEVLQQVKARVPDTEVILITGHASIDHAVAAIKTGRLSLCRQAPAAGRNPQPDPQSPGPQAPAPGEPPAQGPAGTPGRLGGDDRRQPQDEGGLPRHPQGGPPGLQRHHPGGERHRQGTGGPAHPPGKPPCGTSLLWPSIAGALPRS